MKLYWDSSALVLALHDESIRLKVSKDTAITRTHSYSEVFSTLTGGRLGMRYSPDDAFEMIASLATDLTVVEIDAVETMEALRTAGRAGVRGGRIHDYVHALAAMKAGVEKLVTLNESDFTGLIPGLRIAAPTSA